MFSMSLLRYVIVWVQILFCKIANGNKFNASKSFEGVKCYLLRTFDHNSKWCARKKEYKTRMKFQNGRNSEQKSLLTIRLLCMRVSLIGMRAYAMEQRLSLKCKQKLITPKPNMQVKVETVPGASTHHTHTHIHAHINAQCTLTSSIDSNCYI